MLVDWKRNQDDLREAILNPGELNKYVVNPPDGTESAAELKERLENGDFDVDIDKYTIYYFKSITMGMELFLIDWC